MFSAKLSEPTLSATPGGVVGCDLRLRNAGDSAVAVRVEPRGRAGAWAVVLPAKMQVAPGTEACARLTFTVPDTTMAAGETVGFTVRVVGDRSMNLPGTIEIVERRDVRLSVHPLISRDRRQGRHTVVLANRGNVPALLTLGAADEGGAATVRLASRVVVVEPGEESRVELVVAARRRFLGRRPRPHRVTVSGEQEAGPRLDAAAVFFQNPLRWKSAAAAATAVALVAGIGAWRGVASNPPAVPPGERASAVAAEEAAAAGVPSNCPNALAPAAAGEPPVVPIAAFAYCPAIITVAAGTEVRWRNDDLAPHSATAEGGFDTGVLGQGQSAAVRFDRPGSYAYYCKVHPGMRGSVVVTG